MKIMPGKVAMPKRQNMVQNFKQRAFSSGRSILPGESRRKKLHVSKNILHIIIIL